MKINFIHLYFNLFLFFILSLFSMLPAISSDLHDYNIVQAEQLIFTESLKLKTSWEKITQEQYMPIVKDSCSQYTKTCHVNRLKNASNQLLKKIRYVENKLRKRSGDSPQILNKLIRSKQSLESLKSDLHSKKLIFPQSPVTLSFFENSSDINHYAFSLHGWVTKNNLKNKPIRTTDQVTRVEGPITTKWKGSFFEVSFPNYSMHFVNVVQYNEKGVKISQQKKFKHEKLSEILRNLHFEEAYIRNFLLDLKTDTLWMDYQTDTPYYPLSTFYKKFLLDKIQRLKSKVVYLNALAPHLVNLKSGIKQSYLWNEKHHLKNLERLLKQINALDLKVLDTEKSEFIFIDEQEFGRINTRYVIYGVVSDPELVNSLFEINFPGYKKEKTGNEYTIIWQGPVFIISVFENPDNKQAKVNVEVCNKTTCHISNSVNLNKGILEAISLVK